MTVLTATTRKAVTFLELEITRRCQLTCAAHCYAQAGPTGDHGTMTAGDWFSVIADAAAMGVVQVQLIGGEPTMHPQFTEILTYAISAGLKVEVYTNLVRVRAAWWDLYSHPQVSLATSYYADTADGHDAVTGRAGSHAATRSNISEAVRRGIPIRAGIIDVLDGQRVEEARADLEALGVTRVSVDRVRGVGHGAAGHVPTVDELCGRCGRDQAAISPDGNVWMCVLSRWMTSPGNVKTERLADILDSPAMASLIASIPPRAGEKDPCAPDKTGCQPKQDGGDCQPAEKPACKPAYDPKK